MNKPLNRKRLFAACSMALVVTAMTFSIRANLLGVLGQEFGLPAHAIGEIASAAFWGFTLAMFIGGPLCDKMGIGSMYLLAFASHIAGIILTIFSGGYWMLFISTLMVGIGNGFIESASYTMVSSMYPDDKAKKINAWHIWFPGGIVIGGLLSYALTLLYPANWKLQMLVMIPFILIYGFLFLKQQFPQSERVSMGVTDREIIRECFRPLFLFMMICMLMTSATELGTNQWIAELLSSVGVPAILLLVFINGIMAIGRANAGFVLKRISLTGLLLLSAVLSFIGLLWLGYAQGYMAFAAAAVFAVGICFFWPSMIAFVSVHLPKTGPLGLSIMGGAGLLSTALALPFMGSFYETHFEAARNGLAASGLVAQEIIDRSKLYAGSHTLKYVSILPGMLILAFAFLHYRKRKQKTVLLNARH